MGRKAYPLKNLSVAGMKRRLSKTVIPNCFAACNCDDECLRVHCDCGHSHFDNLDCIKCGFCYLNNLISKP